MVLILNYVDQVSIVNMKWGLLQSDFLLLLLSLNILLYASCAMIKKNPKHSSAWYELCMVHQLV